MKKLHEKVDGKDLVNKTKTIGKNSDISSENMKFKCDLCDFQSNTNQGLKTHISRKHTKYSEESVPKDLVLNVKSVKRILKTLKNLKNT